MLTLALWTGIATADEGPLVVGGKLGSATIEAVEEHPEYQRVTVRTGDGPTLWEITTGSGGLCDHGGLTVYPRPELLDGPAAAAPADHAPLCERLASGALTLRPRVGPKPASAVVRPAADPLAPERAPHPTWTHALLAVVGLLALLRIRPTRAEWGVAFLALLVRLALAPVGITNGELGGYEKLVIGRGALEEPPYGAGWGALMGWVPGWPEGVFDANLTLSTLAALLVARIGRSLGGPRAGLAAGVLLALLPVHIGVSRSENMHVSVLTFQLLSVAAALAYARSRSVADIALAITAAGFVAQLRPDALVFLPVPLLALLLGVGGAEQRRPSARAPLPRRLRVAALSAVLLAGAGLAAVAALPPDNQGGVLQMPAMEVLFPRFGQPGREQSFVLFAHLGFTPWPYALLAVAGIAGLAAPARRPVFLFLLAWAALTTLPFTGKVYPLVDAVRLQLTGQAPMVLLAGLGASFLPAIVRNTSVAVAIGVAISQAPHPWVQTEEWAFASQLHRRAGSEKIQFDPDHQRSAAWVAVMNGVAGSPVWTLDPAPLRYVGLTCIANGRCDTTGCEEIAAFVLTGRADVDLRLPTRRLALFRCPAAEAPAAGGRSAAQ